MWGAWLANVAGAGLYLGGCGGAGAMKKASVAGVIALAVITAGGSAVAAELPVKAPARQAYDWSGLYFGGHVGYGQGRADATVTDPAVTSLANTFGGNIAGVQLGYN